MAEAYLVGGVRPPAGRHCDALAGVRTDGLAALVASSEAFASQSLASLRRHGLDPSIGNSEGGAIALGHPLGSSGSRIVITLLGRLAWAGATRGLATICIGVGQGQAFIVERAGWAIST